MDQNFDTQPYYRKLANNEALTNDEVIALLKAVDLYQTATVYLADCHAATLEGLPKSTSKSERARQTSICRTAAGLLAGDSSGIRHLSRLEAARERCLRAADGII